MSCGCNSSDKNVSLPQVSNLLTRAGMCQTCPFSLKDNKGGAVGCLKLPDTQFKDIENCPIGRFTKDTDVTKYAGLKWYGVPEFLRWVLAFRLGREPRQLPGCGCLVSVKSGRLGEYLEPLMEVSPLFRKWCFSFWGELRSITTKEVGK